MAALSYTTGACASTPGIAADVTRLSASPTEEADDSTADSNQPGMGSDTSSNTTLVRYAFRDGKCPTNAQVTGITGHEVSEWTGLNTADDGMCGMFSTFDDATDYQVDVGIDGIMTPFDEMFDTEGYRQSSTMDGVWIDGPNPRGDGGVDCYLYALAVPGYYDTGRPGTLVNGLHDWNVLYYNPPSADLPCEMVEKVFAATTTPEP